MAPVFFEIIILYIYNKEYKFTKSLPNMFIKYGLSLRNSHLNGKGGELMNVEMITKLLMYLQMILP